VVLLVALVLIFTDGNTHALDLIAALAIARLVP